MKLYRPLQLFLCIGGLLLSTLLCAQGPYPIQFSISGKKIVKDIPKKDRDFTYLLDSHPQSVKSVSETRYYKMLQRSYYTVISKNDGGNHMQLCEILANGCIPYILDLDEWDPRTLQFFPLKLIREAMHLRGVSDLKIDHDIFDHERYFEILSQLLDHTRTHLSSKSMAEYLLNTMNYSGTGKILFISNNISPDYLRCSILIGLKELLGELVVDVPKIPHIYKSYKENLQELFARGISYTRVIDDLEIDRTNIEKRIKEKEFELVIYGSVHRGLGFYYLVQKNYPADKVVYLCGEDGHTCTYTHLSNLFLRQYEIK